MAAAFEVAVVFDKYVCTGLETVLEDAKRGVQSMPNSISQPR